MAVQYRQAECVRVWDAVRGHLQRLEVQGSGAVHRERDTGHARSEPTHQEGAAALARGAPAHL